MSNILLIGATGTLGSTLRKHIPCICSDVRFNDRDGWYNLFQQNNFNTVIHVARSCRKQIPRRDYLTMRDELQGMINILDAGGNCCNFIYASSKVVYGITNQIEHWMNAEDIVPYFNQSVGNKDIQQVVNIPNTTFNLEYYELPSNEHKIYAQTKTACEHLIQAACKSYTIFRIWDINKNFEGE